MEAFITEKASRRQQYDSEQVRHDFILYTNNLQTNLFTIIKIIIIVHFSG